MIFTLKESVNLFSTEAICAFSFCNCSATAAAVAAIKLNKIRAHFPSQFVCVHGGGGEDMMDCGGIWEDSSLPLYWKSDWGIRVSIYHFRSKMEFRGNSKNIG